MIDAAWVALMDQTSAALTTHAAMCGKFREALINVGFTSDQAVTLVNIWYEQTLELVAERHQR